MQWVLFNYLCFSSMFFFENLSLWNSTTCYLTICCLFAYFFFLFAVYCSSIYGYESNIFSRPEFVSDITLIALKIMFCLMRPQVKKLSPFQIYSFLKTYPLILFILLQFFYAVHFLLCGFLLTLSSVESLAYFYLSEHKNMYHLL